MEGDTPNLGRPQAIVTRIGIDARCGRQISVGMRTYIQEVASRLPRIAPEFDYRFYSEGEQLAALDQVALPFQMWRDRIDVAHFMSQYVPLLARGRFTLTIHDVIHLRYPEMHKRTVGPYYAFVVRQACRRAARVITSDERTIEDLVALLGIDPAKIRVVPLAPRERFLVAAPPFRAQRPYLINVGNHRAHKDLATLLQAWSRLPAGDEIDLLLTGPDDFGGELQRLSNQHRRVVALGDVEDDALASYYAGALALVHPSLLEGFGLPLVEAMAQGCPVIATTTSIPGPVAAAALTFEPRDVEGLSTQIRRLLDDQALRTSLVERGREAVRALSWDRTARETAAIYREIIEEQ
ncbi:MAG TPA: glycosyltransferase family 1 protein [Candidatus Acidoferrales bacterium]|nr:glycosyltransferase family 1 protein [Candidatus Acidoferrales bacterium]